MSTCGLVAMTSASHAEGRQFEPGQVYLLRPLYLGRADQRFRGSLCACHVARLEPSLRAFSHGGHYGKIEKGFFSTTRFKRWIFFFAGPVRQNIEF